MCLANDGHKVVFTVGIKQDVFSTSICWYLYCCQTEQFWAYWRDWDRWKSPVMHLAYPGVEVAFEAIICRSRQRYAWFHQSGRQFCPSFLCRGKGKCIFAQRRIDAGIQMVITDLVVRQFIQANFISTDRVSDIGMRNLTFCLVLLLKC